MESKKINQLATNVAPQTSDLTIIGDPTTGVSKKITLLQIANLFATTGTVSSVAVTETGDALTITGSPITSTGTINIGFAGDATQYVRGDGALADFPTSTGGGSSVSYYLNSSVSQGTIGGVAYRELSKEPVSGAGTDITASTNGYIASYITDANDPSLLEVPGGNFNCEFYFSVNSNNHDPSFYAELYKYDGSTFTLLGSSQSVPEYLSNGTTLSPYYFAIPVATAVLSVTDRLAIRIYVNVDGRVVTLHTENNHLCQVVTTFSKGLISLNNLTRQNQFFATGTSGTDFNISSTTATHTFNIPSASATNRGLITTGSQTIAGDKTFSGSIILNGGVDMNNTLNVNSGFFIRNNVIGSTLYTSFSINKASNIETLSYLFSTGFASNLLFNDAATYSYTFPTSSGTVALTSNLSSYVPYTGATTNVDLGDYSIKVNGILAYGASGSGGLIAFRQTGTLVGAATGSAYIGSVSAGKLNIYFGDAGLEAAILDNSLLTADRTYNLPDANGTIALTSDLTNYVTLGTSQNISGIKTFSVYPLFDAGIFIKHGTNISAGGYTGIGATTTGLILGLAAGGSGSLIFNTSSNYQYTFPSATGTLALTSDLSAYLPLAGGTLTGALSGTSATFSGSLGVNSTIRSTGQTDPASGVGMELFYRSADTSSYIQSYDRTNGAWKDVRIYGNTLYFGTQGTNNLTIASTGAATFSSSVTATGGLISNGGAIGYGGGELGFGVTTSGALSAIYTLSTGSPVLYFDHRATSNTGSFVFRNGTGGANTLLTIASTGAATFSSSVGVGGTSAGNFSGVSFTGPFLDVAGVFQVKGTSANGVAIIQLGGDTYRKATIETSIGTADPFLAFGTASSGSSSSNTERMRITSAGNVGIGSTTFTYAATNRTNLVLNGTTDSLFEFQNGGSARAYLYSNTDGLEINSLGSRFLQFVTNAEIRMRITSGGDYLFNTTTASYGFFVKDKTAGFIYAGRAQGSSIWQADNNVYNSIVVYSTGADGYNGAGTAIILGKNSSTNRSLNAGGTINASGADYAEYMTKAIDDSIAKGDIVGVDKNGLLTNIFKDAKSFVVKSTDPSYVGGDTWGSVDDIGKLPNDATDEQKAEHESKLEEARAKVDRIAFSGQIPCNVYNANVGDYIIPIELNGKISGQAVTNPTFEQYQISVGKVWKIMDDGRAWIAVKIG